MHDNTVMQAMVEYKDTIKIILTGLAGAIAHSVHKIAKWQRISFLQAVANTIACWFWGLLVWFVCSAFGIEWNALHFCVGCGSYAGIIVLDSIDMIKARVVYDLFIDFIRYKVWKK